MIINININIHMNTNINIRMYGNIHAHICIMYTCLYAYIYNAGPDDSAFFCFFWVEVFQSSYCSFGNKTQQQYNT